MKIIKPKTKAKKQTKRELPPDTYSPLVEPKELVIDDNKKFVFNLQRAGEEGLPHVDVRTFQTTEAYTGFTRKGINFPLDMLPDVIRALEEVSETAEKEKYYDEFED